jgi:endonuclease/exonuclease/phosphatase family metal-dependent hydrolase
MSFNLRFDTSEDGENQWSNRKLACVKMLQETKPSIFGIQEGLNHQVTYLDENFSDYDYVGVGRDDGYTSGEYSAIFYQKSKFDLVDDGNFWLSQTPDYPSLGWDANNIRIVTWAQLKYKEKDKTIFVFNTHFDHLGKTAQKESAKLLLSKINEIAGDEHPTFITGDFNVLIGNSALKPIIKKYYSARRFADRSDNNKSFNAWGRWYLDRNIDYIFYKNIYSLSFKTVNDDYGVPYISDHYPIISHFKLQ